ncbi:hypothetical protein AB4525_03415 [Vibrio breoganii]
MRFSSKQFNQLESLGLNAEQISHVKLALKEIPETPDIKRLNKLTQQLKSVSKLMSEIEGEENRTYFSIKDSLLQQKIDLSAQPIEHLLSAVAFQRAKHEGVVINEFTETGEYICTRAVTPKSKNYYRFEEFTAMWKAWGRTVATSLSSEFISFLTICIEGDYSEKGADRIRSNYRRVYMGLDVTDTPDNVDFDELELAIDKRVEGSDEFDTQSITLSSPAYSNQQISDHISTLKRKRN